MENAISVATLFDERPVRWGLRGDPWLWWDMRERLASVALPETGDELVAMVAAKFEELTGHPVSHSELIFLEKYDHGGMSGGTVSPEFWRDTAIPLLRQRYSERSRGPNAP
jgi:hypothetical protein